MLWASSAFFCLLFYFLLFLVVFGGLKATFSLFWDVFAWSFTIFILDNTTYVNSERRNLFGWKNEEGVKK